MENSVVDNRENQIENTIKKYSVFVFRIAFNNLKNRQDAEDIMQEVFISMVTAKVPFDDDVYLKNWLAAVTLNKCRDFKKTSHIQTEPLDDYLSLQAPETQAVMEELWQLPVNYRNVIYLHYYEKFTIKEIAEILGKNTNTIGSWLIRARKKLSKILEEGESYNG